MAGTVGILFGITKKQRVKESKNAWDLKRGTIVGPETSVNCHSTLRIIPEGRRYYLHRRGSLKSRIENTLFTHYKEKPFYIYGE
jgi:hypothetical protein